MKQFIFNYLQLYSSMNAFTSICQGFYLILTVSDWDLETLNFEAWTLNKSTFELWSIVKQYCYCTLFAPLHMYRVNYLSGKNNGRSTSPLIPFIVRCIFLRGFLQLYIKLFWQSSFEVAVCEEYSDIRPRCLQL